MLRIALPLLLVPLAAAAQETARVPPVDFVLRPTQDVEGDAFLDPFWDGTVTEPALMAPPPAGPFATPPAPLNPPRPRAAETDPFAAPGVNVGAFILRPAIELGVRASIEHGEAGSHAVGFILAPELVAAADGGRYAAEAELRGEWVVSEDAALSGSTVEARLSGRYDFTAALAVDGALGYTRETEDFGEAGTPDDAAERPAVDRLDAELGLTRRFGRVAARLGAFVERSLHGEVALAGGGVDPRTDLDNTEFGASLRTAYDGGGSLAPFVEVAAGSRVFDEARDEAGYARGSVWGELRGGIVVDRGEKLSGEVSLGYRREAIDDDRLDDLDVILANAAVLWSPRRLTEVRFDLTTEASAATDPGVAATILYSGSFALARRLTPRLTAEIGGGLDYEFAVGGDQHDVTFTGHAEAAYAFSRFAALVGRYTFEHTEALAGGTDGDEHEIELRLRLAR
jgi:hypothetical protein